MNDENYRREQYLEKPLPSSKESEAAILGGIIVDNDLINQVIENLSPEDFYSPLHKKVYEAMIKLFERMENINPILIAEEIKKTGSVESIGGISTIVGLTYGLPMGFDVSDYIKIVKEKSTTRQLIKICSNIQSIALDEETEIADIIEMSEQQIFDLRPNDGLEGFTMAGAEVHKALTKIAERAEKAKDDNVLLGLSTGFKDLNRKLLGLIKQDLIVIGGRPSLGKSALGIDIALNATDDDREAVIAVFSLEVSKQANAIRMLSQRAMIDSGRLKIAQYVSSDIPKIKQAQVDISEKKILIDDTPDLTDLEIRARARRLAIEHKRLDLIIIDHLDLIKPNPKITEKRHQLTAICKSLKATAKLLDVPIILISPLSRSCEKRNPPRPMMSDLAESGGIEYNADVVLLLYREDYYNKSEDAVKTGIAEVIIAKNRDNPTGTVKLAWIDYATTFRDLAR